MSILYLSVLKLGSYTSIGSIMHQVIQQNEGNKHWKFQVKDSAMKEESAYYQYSLQSLDMFPTMHPPPLVMAAANGLYSIFIMFVGVFP